VNEKSLRLHTKFSSADSGVPLSRLFVLASSLESRGWSDRADMKPHLKLAEVTTPDGARLTLHSHDRRFSIRLNGQELMHSAAVSSELELGERAVARISSRSSARVLVGGLGLGFTLDAVLANVGARVSVDVAELIPEVVEWNRTHLAELNGWRLADARVTVLINDVGSAIVRAKKASYDAIILDVDNGPTAMVHGENARLYDARGIQLMIAALKPGGRIAMWSARADPKFASRLNRAGLRVDAVPAKLHATAHRSTYMLYLADKPESRAGSSTADGARV
jgi:spermidine synthase